MDDTLHSHKSLTFHLMTFHLMQLEGMYVEHYLSINDRSWQVLFPTLRTYLEAALWLLQLANETPNPAASAAVTTRVVTKATIAPKATGPRPSGFVDVRYLTGCSCTAAYFSPPS